VMYTVDGTSVTKAIRRQTFRVADIAGTYVGGAMGSVSGCTPSGTFELIGQFVITHSGSNVSISTILDGGTRCTYAGAYAQEGRMGSIVGTLACTGTPSRSGTFQGSEIEAGNSVLVMRYEARYGTCVETGRIAGLKP